MATTTRPPPAAADRPAQSGGPARRRNLSLASISIPLQGLNILKRKPLPTNSPLHQKRSLSVDAPQQNQTSLRPSPSFGALTPIPSPGQASFLPRDLDRNPHGNTPLVLAEPTPTSPTPQKILLPVLPLGSVTSQQVHDRNQSAPGAGAKPQRHAEVPGSDSATIVAASDDNTRERFTGTAGAGMRQGHGRATSSLSSQKKNILGLTLASGYPDVEMSRPKTPITPGPGRKITNFFGFGRSPSAEIPPTPVSSGSLPVSPTHGFSSSSKAAPSALDIPKANAMQALYYQTTPGLPTPGFSSTQVADLELELRELSAELANSLRREMELEDEVERLQAGTQQDHVELTRRTSDYYSDSGAGSVRYPGESEGKIEQLERMRRSAEQSKAKLKVQMSDRLQDALNGRREAEEKSLELHERLKLVDGEAGQGNARELSMQLEETKRRLADESQFRQNFQDLVGGMRLELEQLKNERDNLRDEVVPQLQSRLEGLESDAARSEGMTYEHSRLTHELNILRDENSTLQNARRLQMEMTQQAARFNSIEEDACVSTPSSPSIGSGLLRSKSFANRGATSPRSNSAVSLGLNRTAAHQDAREVLIQKAKDAETQRDALHKALRLLRDRHLVQERKHQKHIKQLEKELAEAQTLTPRRTFFHEEVKNLKSEINILRKRADDVIDQKWQLEKNFSSVKIDLDRAREETGSLRSLLHRRDLFMPDRPESGDGTKALDKTFKELRTAHALSIAHLKGLETGYANSNDDAERTLGLLKKSISDAETERDMAHSQAEEYRQQARSLQKSELDHLNREKSLSSQLYASAQRMDEIANQVQSQIQSNSVLRQKLAEAIERGEREQRSSSGKIADMESKLRELEEKLIAAQQQSEEMLSMHEQEVKKLKDAHNFQLQRTKSALLSPLAALQNPPGSALLAPRTPITKISMAEASQAGTLESRVRELEKALRDAEKDMGDVVSKMTKAQIEVADLQSERDEAMMQARRLQAEYLQEREKVQQLMLAPTTF